MRKVIIFLVLILLIVACWEVVVEGFAIGQDFTIYSYEVVESSSKGLDTLISQLVNANDMEFPREKQNLKTAINEYQSKKQEYEELQAVVEKNTTEIDLNLVDIYDVDFLWTIIGNYGTEEGINLKFDVVKSLTSTISSEEYTICDLRFTVSGDYIPITDFIYDLEDDSRLSFEISSFQIAKGAENLQATFVVREVPINNANLTELTNSSMLNTEEIEIEINENINEPEGENIEIY